MPRLVSKEEANRAKELLLKEFSRYISGADLLRDERGNWIVMLYLPRSVQKGTLPHERIGVRIYHEVVGDARIGNY